jgi:RimJ/RimL family protein N-acetyltransferase
MVDIPTLETPRLRLRAYRLDEFDAYVAMWQEPSVYRFIGGQSMSREWTWMRFLRQIGHWQHLGFGYFAIEDRETGRFIGEGGFQDMKRDLMPSIEGTMEIGYALVPEAQGKGLVEEAMRAALHWGDEHGKGRRYTCMISTDHAASIHVAEKLGFSEFARTTYHDKPVVLLERARPLP